MNSLLAIVAMALMVMQTADAPVESAHRRGPHGLEGWTLLSTVPDQGDQRFPMTLVLARRGHVVRKIDGGPFLWNWMFVDEGRRVAYEAAPFHFSDNCVLQDIKSGKILRQYDCFHDPLAADAPGWVRRLKAHPSDSPH